MPSLVHDGKIINESTVICEYVDRVWPETSLHPTDPYEFAQVRYWSKALDEELHPACGELTFMASHRHTLFKLGEKKLQGCFLGSSNPHHEFPRLLDLWRTGKLDLDAMVTATRPLEEINDAVTDMQAGLGLRTVLSM